jgi:hypothetical protein
MIEFMNIEESGKEGFLRMIAMAAVYCGMVLAVIKMIHNSGHIASE